MNFNQICLKQGVPKAYPSKNTLKRKHVHFDLATNKNKIGKEMYLKKNVAS